MHKLDWSWCCLKVRHLNPFSLETLWVGLYKVWKLDVHGPAFRESIKLSMNLLHPVSMVFVEERDFLEWRLSGILASAGFIAACFVYRELDPTNYSNGYWKRSAAFRSRDNKKIIAKKPRHPRECLWSSLLLVNKVTGQDLARTILNYLNSALG